MLYKRCRVFYLDSTGALTWVQNSGTEVLDCLSEAVLLETSGHIRCPSGSVLDVEQRKCINEGDCANTYYTFGRLCLKACPEHFFKWENTCVASCPLVDGFAPSSQEGYQDVCAKCAEDELATSTGCVSNHTCGAESTLVGKTCIQGLLKLQVV